jgi:Xaa-Pro aminopeptidase
VPALEALGGRKVAVDPDRSVAAIFRALESAGATIAPLLDPTILPKAVKNPVELAGHRAAQARDGAAMVRFLRWLEATAPAGGETELSAAARLEAERAASNALVDLSFDTISGAGPNAAIPHYRVDEASNRTIAPDSIYLVDSGGQYRDGTTDITRTVWIGPARLRRKCATGSPACSRAYRPVARRVPAGHQWGPARRAGAPVPVVGGARLCPWHRARRRQLSFGPRRAPAHCQGAGGQAGTAQELLEGMILSNEPGYYKAGEYGIRIENLVLVTGRTIAGAEGAYLGFDNLTFVPIDRSLVDVDLLSAEERGWFDAYHAQVRDPGAAARRRRSCLARSGDRAVGLSPCVLRPATGVSRCRSPIARQSATKYPPTRHSSATTASYIMGQKVAGRFTISPQAQSRQASPNPPCLLRDRAAAFPRLSNGA